MDITLYKTTDDNRTVNKTLTNDTNKTVELLSEFNFDDLNIRLTGITDTLAFNYLYVPKLKKYYFITDVTYKAKNTCIIACHIDVLMTFKDSLSRCKGLLNNLSQNKYPFSDSYNVPLNSEPKFMTYDCYISGTDKNGNNYNELFKGFNAKSPINVLVAVNDRKATS